MIKWMKGIAASAVLGAAVAAGGQAKAASVPESNDPIKIAIHEWTGQHITSYIAGHILTRMGYKVEYVTASYLPSAVGLSEGTLSYSLEVWENNLGEFYPKLLKEGKIVNFGPTGIAAQEGWLYPVHAKEKCPGLPKWEALVKCAKIFANAETFPKGRFVEYPADWSDRATKLIKGEKLPFEAVAAGSEGALVAELKASVQKKKPLVMMFWAPHWVLSEIKTEWVEIPDDLRKKYSLQIPRVFKTAWPGAEKKWPAAHKFLTAFTVDNAIQQALMDAIDNKGKDALKTTKAWVDANEAHWKPMVDKALAH